MDEGTNGLKKILMVDDDEYLLEMYVMKFKSEGFDVQKINSTDKALDALLSDQIDPDIIIFDMIMPGVDGLEFAKQLRENPKTKMKTLVVLSNQSQQEDIDKAKQIGVDGYIVKALSTPTQVVETVKEIYSKKQIN